MASKAITIILFVSLISVVSFSGITFDDIQKAFAMQHVMMIDDRHFHSSGVPVERTTNEATQMVRDSKATSFDPIYFEHSYTATELPDRYNNNRSH
jgi:hypothetical protein